MSRSLKDEQENSLMVGQDSPASTQTQMGNSVQFPVSEAFERVLVNLVIEDYEAAKFDRDNRDYGNDSKGTKIDFEKWLKGIRDTYTGQRPPKDKPWKFCSNRSLRIGTSILDMLHSRFYSSLINENLLKWRPGESTDVPKVDRIEKFMSWWLFINSKIRPFCDNWIKSVTGYGEAVTETFWSVKFRDTGEVKQIPIQDEMGNPIMNPDGMPAVSQERIVERFESSQSRVYLPDKYFLQKGSRDLGREPVVLEDELFYRELEEGEVNGSFVNIANLLRGMLPVPSNESQSITTEEKEQIRDIKIRNVPVRILKWYGLVDINQDGFPEDVRIIVAPEYKLYISGIRLTDLTYKGIKPVNFTKFDSRFMNPEENWGEGVIEKVKELSDELDAIFNQLTDANTLSVMRPGFYDPAGDLKAPILTLAPNKITPISSPSQNVYFPDISINIQQLIHAIRLVLEFIERLTAASSYVMGKESEVVGGSGTATRTNAIMQSAEQRFELPIHRLRDGISEILNHHLSLVQLNIPAGLESRVLGEKGEPLFGQNELTQEGLAGKYDAYLLPDPSMGSKQIERELASMFYSMLMQNIIVGTDPVKIYKITADLLVSYGKDPVAYLGPAPSADDIDSPEDENTLVIQGDFARVRAQIAENHILHIQKHMELMESPSMAAIPPALLQQITTYLQQHIMEHQQMMQTMMALVQNAGGGGGGKGTDTNLAQGAQGATRMENTSGPLAMALGAKENNSAGRNTPEQTA